MLFYMVGYLKIMNNTFAIDVEIHFELKKQETIILTMVVMLEKQGSSNFPMSMNILILRSVVQEIHLQFMETLRPR